MQRSAFYEAINASTVEAERFSALDGVLLATAAHTNLIARATIPDRWRRHYEDSAQLFSLIPEDAGTLLDIGSGAGFPALVLAVLAASRRPTLKITCCDSVGKKARFLRDAASAAGLVNLQIYHARVEDLPAGAFDTVTARAVTALPNLLSLAAPRLARSSLLIAPKGRRAQEEVDEARERWSFELDKVASRTDRDATVLLISRLRSKSGKRA